MGYPLLDIFYPPHCYLCGKALSDHRYICESCLDSFEQITDPICERCGKPTLKTGGVCSECAGGDREFFLARSFGLYKPGGGLAEAISGLKYEGEKALSKDLAPLLDKGKPGELLEEVDALTFVPLSRTKLKDRKFNQAELLAREVSRMTGVPLFRTLVKSEQTRPQAELNREERLINVRGSFDYEETISYDRVLLIDDVFTTGSTADECSRVLKEAGAERVYVATLARSYPG
ncbi:ComF family protein [Candidatus Bipolaricaulota bacterium]|nr:ComF family protein [Candidatus Bipolaricaulota bacterium]